MEVVNLKRIFLVGLLITLCLCGCSNNTSNKGDKMVSYMEAKEMIINDGAILVDVRTEDEYNEKHIDGALLLPLDTITEDRASDIIENKDSYVILYCRSGNRSHQALEKLIELGYTNVYDFGSISNWKE